VQISISGNSGGTGDLLVLIPRSFRILALMGLPILVLL
jgi:hypothetical protein